MSGPWGALISAGSTIGLNDMANQSNRAAVRDTNLMNSGMAQEQMAWQKHMSDSAHQREVKDLIAAGLNPTLSAGGNGSSTPSGAMGTAQAPPPIIMPDILAMASMAQEQQKIDIQKAATTAGIAKTLSDRDLNKMKTILAQKGVIRANVEGKAAGYVDKFINYLEKNLGKKVPNNPSNTQPKPLQQNSSGGDLQWQTNPN